MRIWTSLARGVVLETLRRKDLWVVAILGLVIMLSAGALGFFGVNGLESFVKDLGTFVIGLFSTILTVATTSRLIPEEIKNRTLYPLLSRPISRLDLLIGKLLGAICVSWISFLFLCVVTALSFVMFGVHFEPILLQYMLCKMLGLVVLASVTLTLSVYMTPSGAATLSLIIAVGSGMIVRALVMAHSSGNAAGPVFKLVNWMVPQYGLFDLGERAANMHWGLVPLWVVGFLALYAGIYSAAMIGLSWAKFRNQAV